MKNSAMYTTTHPYRPGDYTSLMALAELYAATVVLDGPPPDVAPGAYGNYHAATLSPMATWYVSDYEELESALAALGYPPLVWSPVDTTIDYVAASAAGFTPLVLGPFAVLRGTGEAPEGLIPLHIPVNMAFGSGDHATTAGCLAAFAERYENGFRPTHGLDFGSGSALLAIGAAKLADISMLAADNDPLATQIGSENARANGVSDNVTCLTADTPLHPAIQAKAPYPLIFALAQPLMAALAPGGYLILSGFRVEQEGDIRQAYGALTLQARYERDGWIIAVFSCELSAGRR